MRDVLGRIEQKMLSVSFSEVENPRTSGAYKLRCTRCKRLPLSLQVMKCASCKAVVCTACYDIMVDEMLDYDGSSSSSADDQAENSSSARQNTTTERRVQINMHVRCPACKDPFKLKFVSKKILKRVRENVRFRHICPSINSVPSSQSMLNSANIVRNSNRNN